MQVAAPSRSRRTGALMLAGVALAVAAAQASPQRASGGGQTTITSNKGAIERFVGSAVNLPGIEGETISIDLLRYSTDDERKGLVTALAEKGDAALPAALQELPNLGYIWRSGSGFGSFVRYAYRWTASDGEHVVFATEADLSGWQQERVAGAKPVSAVPFTVIEVVNPAKGTGAGKMSLAAKVIGDAAAGTLRLDGYDQAPVMIKGVRATKGS
ncbi:MAG: hypothetical protein FJW23_17145 [Acidimicrobiia bacterium]|nr:hypothetical protein [Acidimicrobiia bacterium]